MSDVAAIKATFSDFRLIKGRKQAQLVLEVPIEQADNALAALGGIPQPHSDRWVAVAQFYVMGVTVRKLDETLAELQKQSGSMQGLLAQRRRETQCQAGEHQNGSGN